MAWSGLDIALFVITGGTILALLQPRLHHSPLWQATVTPLASIIGSGFLIIAPVLGFLVGDWAFAAMLALSVTAYLIGAVIRYNIRHQEPLLRNGRGPRWVFLMERASDLPLVLSYTTSVAFYLRLLASFVFQGLHMRNPLAENLLTTALLLFIGITGKRRGLDHLEILENYSVSIKLSVIAALLAGLMAHDTTHGFALRLVQPNLDMTTIRTLAGLILVVQGFETSKYLGEKYTAAMRIRSMRYAQILSGIIYVAFVILVTPLFVDLPAGHVDEREIIALTQHVAAALPVLLVLGAVMSQFSAGVADTVGAGELLAEATRRKVSSHTGFLVVTLAAIGLVWSANVFEIVTYASRAFALYYLLQTLIALGIAHRNGHKAARALFFALSLLLTFVVLFAIPVEG